MSTDNIVYVEQYEDGKGGSIQEDGFIGKQNISDMTFTFDNVKDITESLHKNKGENSKVVSITHNGRVGYANLTCTYPNKKDISSKIVLTDCIIQYISGMHAEKSTYAKDYVFIGIPDVYVDKLITDALNNSSMNLKPKERTKSVNGYHWTSCTLERLGLSNTCIYFKQPDGEVSKVLTSLSEVLTDMKLNMFAHITFTVSATISNKSKVQELDLYGGQYYLTMKPTEVYITRETDIEGPKLEDLDRRRNETAEPSEKFIASGKLAELAMKSLKI